MEMRVGGDVVEEFEYTPYLLYGPRNYFGEWECIFPRLRAGGVRAESICEVHSKFFLSFFFVLAAPSTKTPRHTKQKYSKRK